MRLVHSSNSVVVFRGLTLLLLLTAPSGCGLLVRPGSVRVADPTRAVADARKLITEEREKPAKPMRAPGKMPETLRLPGLFWAAIEKDHVDLVLYHDPDVTRGARIWSLDATREHKDAP